MTAAALVAARANIAELSALIDTLGDEDWEQPSACPGWRIIDMLAHLGAVAASVVDPPSVPEPGASPLPHNRERVHDLLVNVRRRWERTAVIEEWRTKTPQLLALLDTMQSEPVANETITLPGLGTYPKHMLANALAFDTFCHIRHDLCAPRGPLTWSLSDPTDTQIRPAVEWMMAGLPQMQGPELDATVTVPITLDLTGPGASTWTVHPAAAGQRLTVVEENAGRVVVTSAATDFMMWATRRTSWRTHCAIAGEHVAAEAFLSELNII